MARYRLLVDAYLDHAYYRRGEVVERPDNWKGPMRADFETDKDGRHVFANGEPKLKDVPLFELVKDKS